MSKKTPQVSPPAKRWLSRKEVAFRLGLCCKTISRYQEQGLLNPSYLNQRVVRYDESEVDALINMNRINPQNA